MKNYDLLYDNVCQGLQYIQEQQEVLQPLINFLTLRIKQYIANPEQNDLSLKECLDAYIKLMEQETNSVLVITKMQEIISYCNKRKV